jgi:hypothetical protein
MRAASFAASAPVCESAWHEWPLPYASNVELVYDTSIGTAIRAVHCDSFVGEGLGLSDVSYGGTWWRQKIYVVRAVGA